MSSSSDYHNNKDSYTTFPGFEDSISETVEVTSSYQAKRAASQPADIRTEGDQEKKQKKQISKHTADVVEPDAPENETNPAAKRSEGGGHLLAIDSGALHVGDKDILSDDHTERIFRERIEKRRWPADYSLREAYMVERTEKVVAGTPSKVKILRQLVKERRGAAMKDIAKEVIRDILMEILEGVDPALIDRYVDEQARDFVDDIFRKYEGSPLDDYDEHSPDSGRREVSAASEKE